MTRFSTNDKIDIFPDSSTSILFVTSEHTSMSTRRLRLLDLRKKVNELIYTDIWFYLSNRICTTLLDSKPKLYLPCFFSEFVGYKRFRMRKIRFDRMMIIVKNILKQQGKRTFMWKKAKGNWPEHNIRFL